MGRYEEWLANHPANQSGSVQTQPQTTGGESYNTWLANHPANQQPKQIKPKTLSPTTQAKVEALTAGSKGRGNPSWTRAEYLNPNRKTVTMAEELSAQGSFSDNYSDMDSPSYAREMLDRLARYNNSISQYGSSRAWADARQQEYDSARDEVERIAQELRGLKLESAYGSAVYQDGIYMGEDGERESWYEGRIDELSNELTRAEYAEGMAKRNLEEATGYADYDDYKAQMDYDESQLRAARAAGMGSEGLYQAAAERQGNAADRARELEDKIRDLQLSQQYAGVSWIDGVYTIDEEQRAADLERINKEIEESQGALGEAYKELERRNNALASATRTRYADISAASDPNYYYKVAEGKLYYDAEIAPAEKAAAEQRQQEERLDAVMGLTTGGAAVNNTFRTYMTDSSYKRPAEKWTQAEVEKYYYLVDPADMSAADEYASNLNERYAMEEKYAQTKAIEEWSGKNALTGTVASAGALVGFLASGVDALDKLAEYSARGTITAKPYATATDLSNAVTTGVKNSLNDWSGTVHFLGEDRGAGDLYSVAMSVGQSYAAIAAGGAAGSTLFFFGNGMSNGIDEALSRGAKPGQAIAYGTVCAVIEAATEKYSVDSLLSGMNISNVFLSIAKQAGVEASEEGVSYLLNRMADMVMTGNLQEYNRELYGYMMDGDSYEEAAKKASAKWMKELGWSLVSGAMSGALSSSSAQLYRRASSGTGESPLVPRAQNEQRVEQEAENTRPSQSAAQTAPPEGEPTGGASPSPTVTEEQATPGRAEQNKTAPVEGAENRLLTESDLSDYMQTGVREHVRNAKAEIANKGGSPILTTLKSIKEFISNALAGKTKDEIKAYGKVGSRMAGDVSELSAGKFDINGYYLELDANRLNHMNKHIEADTDGRNIPLTGEQAESLTEYIDNYDEVLEVRERKDGGVRLYLGKQTEDGHVIVVELISRGRRSLQPVTAWQNTPEGFEQNWGNKKRSPDYIPTAKAEDSGYKGTPGDGASSAPPEAFASTDSIAQAEEEGKIKTTPEAEQPRRKRSAGLEADEFSVSEKPKKQTTAQAVRQARQEERAKAQKKLDKKQEQLDKARAQAKSLREENKEIKAGMSAAVKTAIQDERTRQAEREKKQQHVKNINKTIESLSRKLSENSGKRHVPDKMKQAVAGMLQSIDTRGKRAGWRQQAEFAQRMSELASVISKQEKLQAEQGEQAVYLDLPAAVSDRLEELSDKVKTLTEGENLFTGLDDYVWTLNSMDNEDLEQLDNMLSAISKAVENANELISMNATVDRVGDELVREMDGRKARVLPNGKIERVIEWDMLTPVYFFRRLGKPGEEIFKALRRSWGEFAIKIERLQKDAEEMWTEREAKDAEKNLITVKLPWRLDENAGTETESEALRSEETEEVRLTHAQAMSLYGLYMRPQGRGHILGAGIRIGDIKGTLRRRGRRQAKDYLLTDMDLAEIFDQLTDREREIAKAMSRYMSTVGADWGNAVTMKRWGIRSFTEEFYWPIITDRRNQNAKKPEKAGGESLYRLLNMGFTKPLIKDAHNAVDIESAFDVFTNHMVDMAKYNTLALPLLDMMKILNYKQITAKGEKSGKYTTASVQKSLDKVYGEYAQRYWMQLMQDLNGDREGGRRMADPFGTLVSHYKAQSVGANLRVAMLQPTSYLRAGLILDGGDLLYGSSHVKGAWVEALKYSGAAKWKNMGYRDSDINANVRELVKHSETPLDKARDWGMWAAEKADQLTWGALWSASKKSVEKEAERARKKLSHEELIEQTVERFEEVIYRTQVMDSTLTRSTAMRSNEKWTQYATSFMAEPTLSYNMVLDEYANIVQESKKKGFKQAAMDNRGRMFKALAVYASSMTASAAMASIVDAMRDDDEYESFARKWWQAFYGEKFFDGNWAGDLSLVRKLPSLKQFISLVDGYGGGSIEASALTALWDGYTELQKLLKKEEDAGTYLKNSYTDWGKWSTVIRALSVLSGLPVYSGLRDVVAIWNSTYGTWWGSKVQTYDPGTERSIKYAFEDGALTEESARALLVSEGVSEDADAAYWKVEAWKSGDGEYSPYDEVIAAFDARDKTAYENAIDDMEEHGKYRYEIIGKVKEHIQEMQQGTEEEEPSLSKEDAAALLAEYGDMTETAAMEQATKWSCLVETGIDYNQIDDYFYREDINFDKAVEMYEKYAPVDMDAPKLTKHEQAVRDVTEMQCYRDTGIKYDNIRYELAEGRITEEQAYQYRLDYDWQHSAEGAANDVLRYVWIGTDYRMNSITAKKVKVYEQYVKDSGVSKYDYYTVFETNPPDSFSSDLEDPNDPYSYVKNSKRDKIWEHIDSLKLSPVQKDAMAYAYAGVDADSDGKLTKSWIDVDNAPWNK